MNPEIKKILIVALFSPLIGFVLTYMFGGLIGGEKSFVIVMRYALLITLGYAFFRSIRSDSLFIPFIILALVTIIVFQFWLKWE